MRAGVAGAGAAAGVLGEHLAALGAEVRREDLPSAGIEATVRLVPAVGPPRELIVERAGPVAEPGLVDEATAQAVCGVMHVNGRRHGGPRGLAVDYCGAAAGVLGMTGLLAGMLAGEAGPTIVRTSLAEAALLTVSQYLAGAGAEDPEAVDLAPGGPPFVSADGVRFEVETLQPEPWARFWAGLGAPTAAIRAGWRPFQFRYATATAPLPAELHHAAASHTFAELTAAAAGAEVSVCRLYPAAEHAAELGAEPDPPWLLAPMPGAVNRAETRGGTADPLRGIVVLEAGRRIQAPLAAHVLRLLGAEVTRIEPPGGDPLRGMPPCTGGLSARWLALNRGKDAVEVDIKAPRDRERLRTLAARADVFLHNWAPGKAEQLGLGAADLPAGLVYAYTSGWAGRELPDLPPGTDFMVQARTGLAGLVGPPDQQAAPSLLTLLDVLGGLLGAEAVLAGLLVRAQRGTGVAVESSLLGAAGTVRAVAGPPRPPGFRQPEPTEQGFLARPDDGSLPGVGVTTDLADLLADPRMSEVLGRDEYGCPALRTPWRLT
ncbi:CoA transferase [Amycolatopsis aidingensis]|uniref:CoA transferase n=1 Tax=Amycolatopsis aidingensis TaxID=2842453 RepID=UPI001E482FC3|nr:CoA transferase [Amycolatopsis aidingensis]